MISSQFTSQECKMNLFNKNIISTNCSVPVEFLIQNTGIHQSGGVMRTPVKVVLQVVKCCNKDLIPDIHVINYNLEFV